VDAPSGGDNKVRIPKYIKTGQECVNFLEGEVNRAHKHWETFGHAMSAAYSEAYEDQKNLLENVKKRIEARRAADEKFMTFALSLLTVGVGGPVAGALVSRVITKTGAAIAASKEDIEAAVKFAEKMAEKAKEKVAEPIKAGTEKLVKYFNPPLGDPFAPVSEAPSTFGAKLLEEISRMGAVKEDLISGLRRSDQITLEGATTLAEQILDSTYYNDMPAATISHDQLKPKAGIALWVAWALSRDDKYWIKASNQWATANQHVHNESVWDEQFDWEPVRQKLVVDLKVPESQITVRGTEFGWMGRQKAITGLWMWGFMKWAASPQAYKLLFDDSVPKNVDGLQMVKEQWEQRKLGPNGWIAVPQVCYPQVDFGPLTLQPATQ
jgi:hypothetical protein